MFWELELVGTECCQTCDGTIVPPNKVVTTAQLGGECKVREVATCKTSLDGIEESLIKNQLSLLTNLRLVFETKWIYSSFLRE